MRVKGDKNKKIYIIKHNKEKIHKKSKLYQERNRKYISKNINPLSSSQSITSNSLSQSFPRQLSIMDTNQNLKNSKKKNKIIAFTGGCFSGKTTTMHKLKDYLKENTDYKVKTLEESIRIILKKPIDEIRKNPKEYLDFEDEIVDERIHKELEIYKELQHSNNTIYLLDRSITDSLFYVQAYLDKSSFGTDDIIKYCKLHKKLISHIKLAHERIYDYVIEFYPVKGKTDDPFRPSNLEYLKYYEYDAIHIINQSAFHCFQNKKKIKAKFVETNVVYKNFFDDLLHQINLD